MTTLALDNPNPPLKADERVASVEFTEDTFSVALMDGRTISVPLYWYPRLQDANEAQRQNWQISGGGYGLHWLDIDEDLSTAGMLRGAPAPRRQALAFLRQRPLIYPPSRSVSSLLRKENDLKDYNDALVKVQRASNGDTFAILPLQSAIELKDELNKRGILCSLDEDAVDIKDEHTDATLAFGILSEDDAKAIQTQVDSIERLGLT